MSKVTIHAAFIVAAWFVIDIKMKRRKNAFEKDVAVSTTTSTATCTTFNVNIEF